MQFQHLSEKLASDIATALYRLRQGYYDHIDMCVAMMQDPNPMLLPDALTPLESKMQHEQYVRDLEQFVISVGFELPPERVMPEVAPLPVDTSEVEAEPTQLTE